MIYMKESLSFTVLNSELARVAISFYLFNYRIDIITLKLQQSVSPRDSSGGAFEKHI